MEEKKHRPAIDQAVDAIETIAFSAYKSDSDTFHVWWIANKVDDRVKGHLREYADKENAELKADKDIFSARCFELEKYTATVGRGEPLQPTTMGQRIILTWLKAAAHKTRLEY